MFRLASALALLFERAQPNLSGEEIRWLELNAPDFAQGLTRQAAVVCEGIGCLVAEDTGDAQCGALQGPDQLPELMFLLSSVLDAAKGLHDVAESAQSSGHARNRPAGAPVLAAVATAVEIRSEPTAIREHVLQLVQLTSAVHGHYLDGVGHAGQLTTARGAIGQAVALSNAISAALSASRWSSFATQASEVSAMLDGAAEFSMTMEGHRLTAARGLALSAARAAQDLAEALDDALASDPAVQAQLTKGARNAPRGKAATQVAGQ